MNPKLQLFGYEVDAVRMRQAVDTVLSWIASPGDTCRYVVTPNVDHTVMYQEREDLRHAYADAGMVLADGMPVVFASRLLGKPLPERVSGTDLVYSLFETFQQRKLQAEQPDGVAELIAVGSTTSTGARNASFGVVGENQRSVDDTAAPRELRVFLLGAGPGVGERAAACIGARWPAIEVVGTYSPPMGFEKSQQENFQILRRIAMARPDLLLVGLGAPKQELWVHAHRSEIRATAALCIGAAIDFLAGEKPRAPRWMQRCGLEWFHRLASEPKRLAPRYARDAWLFPRIVWREWKHQ